MASGYRDKDKLADALELAQSFKHGGKPDTHGGVKKAKKKSASFQPFTPVSRLALPARGVPNVSMRNYPNAGNFIAHGNNTTKGKRVMGNALDFLNRQDATATSATTPKIEPPTPLSQVQPTNVGFREQPQQIRKRDFEEGDVEERKDRIRKKLDNLASSTSASTITQHVTPAGVSLQHSTEKPDKSFGAPIPFGAGTIALSEQATMAPPSLGRHVEVQPTEVPAVTSSSDTNVWGSFMKFAPRGLVSHPQSEADTKPSCDQSTTAPQIPLIQSAAITKRDVSSSSRPQFQEFVPGGENHHAVQQTAFTPGPISSRCPIPASVTSMHAPSLTGPAAGQHAGVVASQSTSVSQSYVSNGNQLVNPFSNLSFQVFPQSASSTTSAQVQPVLFQTQHAQPNVVGPANSPVQFSTGVQAGLPFPHPTPVLFSASIQPSAAVQPPTLGSGSTKKPKQGLSSSRWAN